MEARYDAMIRVDGDGLVNMPALADDDAPHWAADLAEPLWEDWELDPAEVARRAAIEAERHRGLAEAAEARDALRAAAADWDSDDVSDDDPDDALEGGGGIAAGARGHLAAAAVAAGVIPGPSRGAALRYQNAAKRAARVAPKLDGDGAMLECYADAPRPRPRDWPREPSLAQRFYGTPPSWALLDSGAHFGAIEHSPFGLLPEELLHIVVLFIESKSLLVAMPVVCKLFGQMSRREILWKNVCRLRGWGEDVEGAPADLIPTLDPRPHRPLVSTPAPPSTTPPR